MDMYKFDCGCELPILGPANPGFDIPKLDIDFYKINLACAETWRLIADGKTCGIFQVETDLGANWCKRIKPEKVEHMAAIGALLRPGCLQAKTEDDKGVVKNMPQHYADRKSGKDAIKQYHDVVDRCLLETFGVLCFQEQSIRLVKELAGFTLEEADLLRRALGKKKADEMAKIQTMFISKAKELGIINEQQADEVFGWIKSGERYSFNKSHAVQYGIAGYVSAYIKYHFPKMFYTVWLGDSIGQADGEDDVKKLVIDAQSNGVKVNTPKLYNMKDNFYFDGQELHFGLLNIKKVGVSVLKQLNKLIPTLPKPLKELSWTEFLILVAYNTKSDAMTSLIMAGALDYYKIPRSEMKYHFQKLLLVNENEIEWIKDNCLNLHIIDAIEKCSKTKKEGGGTNTAPRQKILEDIVKMLREPSSDLKDSPTKIIQAERSLLGVGLSYTVAESIDDDDINCSCAAFKEGKTLDQLVLGVEIVSVRAYNIKNGKSKGKNMYYLDITDGTSNIGNCTVFPEQFEEYGPLITPGNKVVLYGKKDNKYNSLTVNKVKQA